MDWTKAKTILIIALLITNIFLILLYTILKADIQPGAETLMAETVTLLEEKKIFINGDLPEEHPKMPVLIVEYDYINHDELQEKLYDQTIEAGFQMSEGSAGKIAEDFLKKNELWSNSVILDRIERNDEEAIVYYRNEYEGIPVEDSYMNCKVVDGIVTEVNRFWLRPLECGGSKKATISASAALINLMRSKDEGKSIIVEKMEMVYWLDPSEYGDGMAVSDTALPAWKIIYNNGQVKHIPAYID